MRAWRASRRFSFRSAVAYFIDRQNRTRSLLRAPGRQSRCGPRRVSRSAHFLILGYRIWPVVFGAATVLYASTLGSGAGGARLAVGNTLEGLLAAYLVNRFAGGTACAAESAQQPEFAGVVLLASVTLTATVNTLVLIFSGLAYWTDYGALWLVLALGSLVGMLVTTPPILLVHPGIQQGPSAAEARRRGSPPPSWRSSSLD